jgi:hypothetical protein
MKKSPGFMAFRNGTTDWMTVVAVLVGSLFIVMGLVGSLRAQPQQKCWRLQLVTCPYGCGVSSCDQTPCVWSWVSFSWTCPQEVEHRPIPGSGGILVPVCQEGRPGRTHCGRDETQPTVWCVQTFPCSDCERVPGGGVFCRGGETGGSRCGIGPAALSGDDCY